MRSAGFVSSLICLLIILASCIAGLEIKETRHDWMPDSQIYLWMTLKGEGVPADIALQDTRSYMLGELDKGGKGEIYRSLYSDHPPSFWDNQFALFNSRPLYPALASKLYPRFGPMALKYVSAVAYVATVVVMFLTLLIMTSPLKSAIGAVVFATEQIVLHNAILALTDQLALFFWMCALGATFAYQIRPQRSWLIAIVIASILLTLTRPAFFLPLGAAAGCFLALRTTQKWNVAWAPFFAALPAMFLFIIYGAAVHGPSVLSQLHWQYVSQNLRHGFGAGHGPIVWYFSAVLKGLGSIILSSSREAGGLTLALLAVFGLVRTFRDNGPARIGIMAATASSIALLVNPIDVDRQVVLPMSPLFVILAIAGLDSLRSFKKSTPVEVVGSEAL